jgi:hypothetical protein
MLRAVKPALLSLSLVAAVTPACDGGKATPAECKQMLDKYIDMTVAADPALAELSPREAAAAREMKTTLRKADAAYGRVEQQCEREVSQREYRCAMKAPTPETWQACID